MTTGGATSVYRPNVDGPLRSAEGIVADGGSLWVLATPAMGGGEVDCRAHNRHHALRLVQMFWTPPR